MLVFPMEIQQTWNLEEIKKSRWRQNVSISNGNTTKTKRRRTPTKADAPKMCIPTGVFCEFVPCGIDSGPAVPRQVSNGYWVRTACLFGWQRARIITYVFCQKRRWWLGRQNKRARRINTSFLVRPLPSHRGSCSWTFKEPNPHV